MATFEEIDFDELEDEDKNSKRVGSGKPSDFAEIMASMISRTNIMGKILLFILFIVIVSDLFVQKILARSEGLVSHMEPTSRGVVVQGIFLVLGLSVIELLLNMGVL